MTLQNQFHQAMIAIYEQAKSECNYTASYFIQMVDQYGGINAAKRLLASSSPQEGFTKLWECGRLDLSVEAHVLKSEFATLFSDEEREIARQRLADYGYHPK